jgi:hypothetical protein
MKQKLNIKGILFKAGDLVQYRNVNREYFGIQVFHAEQQKDDWSREAIMTSGDSLRALSSEEMGHFLSFRSGLVIDGPRHKRFGSRKRYYFTYFKVLLDDQKLYWINLKHLFPLPRATKKGKPN